MRQRRTSSRLVLAILVILFGLPAAPGPAFAATDDWDRVRQLEPNSRIVVRTLERGSVSGSLVAAGPDDVTVRAMGENHVFARDKVLEVLRVRTRSNVPLVVAGVAAGLAISSAVVYGCSQAGVCVDSTLFLVVAPPFLLGAAAHRAVRETVTTIYRQPAVRSGDAASPEASASPRGGPTDWESVRRFLPPSLQGRR
jgi:hypothetical protein